MAGSIVADASEQMFKRSSSARSKRSKSARKASVKLPAMQSARRSAEEPLDVFQAFKTFDERKKFARYKEARMLDDKHIHSCVLELKYKAHVPRMEGLCNIESAKPFQSQALSDIQQLTEQLQKSMVSGETQAKKRATVTGEETKLHELRRHFRKIQSQVLDEAVVDQSLPPLRSAR